MNPVYTTRKTGIITTITVIRTSNVVSRIGRLVPIVSIDLDTMYEKRRINARIDTNTRRVVGSTDVSSKTCTIGIDSTARKPPIRDIIPMRDAFTAYLRASGCDPDKTVSCASFRCSRTATIRMKADSGIVYKLYDVVVRNI